MGIHNTPSIYNQGLCEIELHEKVLHYADDWIDTSSDWRLQNDAKVYVRNNNSEAVEKTIEEAFIFNFSKKAGLLYIQCRDIDGNIDSSLAQSNVVLKTSDITVDYTWTTFIYYVGNKFECPPATTNRPLITDYVEPNDVNRGDMLFTTSDKDTFSTKTLCRINYVGAQNTSIDRCGIALFPVNLVSGVRGIYLSRLLFNVLPL